MESVYGCTGRFPTGNLIRDVRGVNLISPGTTHFVSNSLSYKGTSQGAVHEVGQRDTMVERDVAPEKSAGERSECFAGRGEGEQGLHS